MKVFHFDPITGKRGPFIENAAVATHISNTSGVTANLPQGQGQIWSVADKALKRSGDPITYDHPVCFCTGERNVPTGGTAWHWVVLLSAKKS